MGKRKIKVAVVYNESQPEMYRKSNDPNPENPEFKTYFEVDETTPMEEYDYVAERLNALGFNAYTLNIHDSLEKMLDNFKEHKPDVIFNFVEIYKEDSRLEMNIVGIYELLGIPYTGAPALALANCQNKILAKRMLTTNGVRVPSFFMVKKKATQYRHNLNYPLLIKPSLEDASVGIENESIVHNSKELKDRIEYVLHYFEQPVLVEEFIEGRELNVAVMGSNRLKVLPISEIDFTKMPDHLHNIVSYQAKWDPHHESYHKTIPKCPAPLPKKIEVRAINTAIKAFRIMGCRGYARVDMRLSKNKNLYVLEVNPNPDLTEGAGFMRSAEHAGMSYGQAIKRIVKYAISGNGRM
ncbi:MAG: ATP-grasp domain-containing protein [Ignavibacteria bacterium]|nr:ATP-grasp domain-containing protein [Ignavibacteria bacterium]MBT8382805.1 ATP-grasp domain-containing protein [Ignavibacteria bacterium]MBT8392692.1 ATP-grasp domain-containing protein [Ignavibacteria bacterium]NNJ52528.1 ATP-grasp domain-containing protein [Ignavibacteriaceae bacterium]NNL21973.1 ATP-grasp domain-containing protein [Ignavibacteriaceae bacterium]